QPPCRTSRHLMRLIFTIALLTGLAAAQTPPTVGVIDFYGLNKLTQDRVRKSLGFHEGDPLPRSKANVEEVLDTLPGVVESHLEAVCCDGNRMVLYVGIEERGAAHFDVREPPDGEVMLSPEIITLYRRFFDAFEEAVRRGSTAEDLTNGHSLMADPLAREIQLQFPDVAAKNLPRLRD